MNSLMRITTQTPVGLFHMIAHAVDGVDVVKAAGFGTVEKLLERLPRGLHGLKMETVNTHTYQQAVEAYFAGDLVALNRIPRHQEGTEFQEKVWQALGEMKPGETLSYKELADKSGNPAAIRAAGTICGLNKLVLLVPCHRILKSDGGVGNYLYGADMKRFLLQHEGALTHR